MAYVSVAVAESEAANPANPSAIAMKCDAPGGVFISIELGGINIHLPFDKPGVKFARRLALNLLRAADESDELVEKAEAEKTSPAPAPAAAEGPQVPGLTDDDIPF